MEKILKKLGFEIRYLYDLRNQYNFNFDDARHKQAWFYDEGNGSIGITTDFNIVDIDAGDFCHSIVYCCDNNDLTIEKLINLLELCQCNELAKHFKNLLNS